MFCTFRWRSFARHGGDVQRGNVTHDFPAVIVTHDPCEDARNPAETSLWCSGASVRLSVRRQKLVFRWGHSHELGSAAYWVEQARRAPPIAKFNIGENLAEEVAVCILGGYGMPAKVGLAGFRALKSARLILTDPLPSAEEIERVLREPLDLGKGRTVHYRFPAQRASRLAGCLRILASTRPPEGPADLRAWLLGLPGIGVKTASWIVRNYCASSDVAIIDIHIQRAGVAAGFFSPSWLLPRDYHLFEAAFLEVARMGGVEAAALDACIWQQLQSIGRATALLLTGARSQEPGDVNSACDVARPMGGQARTIPVFQSLEVTQIQPPRRAQRRSPRKSLSRLELRRYY